MNKICMNVDISFSVQRFMRNCECYVHNLSIVLKSLAVKAMTSLILFGNK